MNKCNKMSLDEVLINLKVISHIKKSEKMTIRNNILDADKYYFLQPIIRWYYDESRIKIVDFILNILCECKIHINECKKNENYKIMSLIRNALECSKLGLNNLKYTYIKSIMIMSKIEWIEEQFEMQIGVISDVINP